MKPGDLVEFTDAYHASYTLGDPELARYGVIITVHRAHLAVRTAAETRVMVPMDNVHATGWAGWVPEDLEDAYAQLNPGDWGDEW